MPKASQPFTPCRQPLTRINVQEVDLSKADGGKKAVSWFVKQDWLQCNVCSSAERINVPSSSSGSASRQALVYWFIMLSQSEEGAANEGKEEEKLLWEQNSPQLVQFMRTDGATRREKVVCFCRKSVLVNAEGTRVSQVLIFISVSTRVSSNDDFSVLSLCSEHTRVFFV